ncbi:glycosyltransferase [Desulfovibrio sp. OttesenSCG-928-G15]|nr:glycosyltransferase [Desulfovibrio sp. OttesenSCG-928-G15]
MSTSQAECSIIIPVFNKWELTRACLASIQEHSAGHDLEIIVVNNGSDDATGTDLAAYGAGLFGSRFSSLTFAENRNYGPANNAGAKAATAPILFFLNNDTVLTPGCLAPLFAALRADDAPSALGPLLLYPDDSVQHLGVAYGTNNPEHCISIFRLITGL